MCREQIDTEIGLEDEDFTALLVTETVKVHFDRCRHGQKRNEIGTEDKNRWHLQARATPGPWLREHRDVFANVLNEAVKLS